MIDITSQVVGFQSLSPVHNAVYSLYYNFAVEGPAVIDVS